MNFNTNRVFDQQDCLVVLVGKKVETPKNLPAIVQEELKLFSEKSSEDLHSLTLGGKHYFLCETAGKRRKIPHYWSQN
jgi:hypothetical protein